MAAGLGFKDFQTGEVLTAADVDGYLMQGVWVFASATARDAAVTSPQEGNFAYLKDTNVTTYYTGSAWANLDTTGMTNPMTTTGDTIYSSSGSTPARLGIGTAGQVLRVNSGGTAPEWAAPAGGGKVLQVVQATYGTATTIATTTLTDTGLSASITPSSATSKILVMYSGVVRLQASQSDTAGLKSAIIRTSTKVLGWDNNYTTRSVISGVGAITLNVLGATIATNYLDSPATTSATTYKIQMAAHDTTNSGQVIAQFGDNEATLILMEIGA